MSDLEAVLGAESFATSLAVVRTVPGMSAHVGQQAVSGVESPRTLRARVRTSADVLHHVLLEIGTVLERPPASVAHLGFFPGVDAFVHLQSGRALKLASTSGTTMSRFLRRTCGFCVLTGRCRVSTDAARLWMLSLLNEYCTLYRCCY